MKCWIEEFVRNQVNKYKNRAATKEFVGLYVGREVHKTISLATGKLYLI